MSNAKIWILAALGTVVAFALWAALVVVGTIEGWWRASLAPRADTAAFFAAATRKIDEQFHGNVVFRLIERGTVSGEHYASKGTPVDADTLFQVASLGKWIAAAGVMTLVESGKLDLDTPVSRYLTRWALPKSDFDNDGVTVRRLLSHTAGLTDGLGYAGFPPGVAVQPLTDSLTHAADASPNADGRVRVGIEPGTEWRYSGGGYTLLQLLIEEISGESFEAYMHRAIFAPLGMTRSVYHLNDFTPNVATFYDRDGTVATHYRFTSLAATSLYTTAADLTRLVQSHLDGQTVLRPETLRLMREPHGYQFGSAIWGLGTMLYAPNNRDDFVIGHDGDNEPAINTAVRFDPSTGDGIIVLETGDDLLATAIAGDWVFWHVGSIDFLSFAMRTRDVIAAIIAGWLVILIAAGVLLRRRHRAALLKSSAT